MRIRKTWPSSPSPIIPSPSHLPFSNTPSQQQPEVTRQLHPSEALVQRIRDLSYRFHQRFKQPPRNLHPEMKKAGEGNEEEEETKREDCIQPNPIQLDALEREKEEDRAKEKEEDRAKEKVTSIENGITSTRRYEKTSSSDSSCHLEGRWLEEEKSFPLKKRKSGFSLGGGGGIEASSGEKNTRMRSTFRNTNITKTPNDGDAGEQLELNCIALMKIEINTANDAAIKGINGDGVVSMEDKVTTKKPHDNKNNVLANASGRRASIVIEGMQMTSNPTKRGENPVHVNCAIAKNRGRRAGEKEGDREMEKAQVGVTPNSATNRRRRSVTRTSDEGEEHGGGGGVVRRRHRRQLKDKLGDTAEGGGGALMQGSRCSRYNGRGWRCRQITLAGYALCEHHLGKGRMKNMGSAGKYSAPSRIAAPQPHNSGPDEERRTSWSSSAPAPSLAATSLRKGKEVMIQDEEEDEMQMKKRGREAFLNINHI